MTVPTVGASVATGRDPALLAGLNDAQREAVLHDDGPLLVLAGAGSGKTRVLTTRIARLIGERGAPAERILAVTFTNKAAGEMRERIARILGNEPAGMWMGTFHSIGARMLRRAAAQVHRTPSFTIYDDDEQLTVVKRLMERHRISPKQYAPRAIRSAISDAKNALVRVEEYTQLARDPFAQAVALVYADMESTLRASNAVDFDDLLLLPVAVLESNENELRRWQKRFDHILVDEYQDTNRAQYRFVQLLAREHRNVCVVGDDDQSIYGWRGADIRNILDFTKDFPNAAVVRLEENYRSTPPILELANVVISANTARMGKTLRPTRSGGERAVLVRSLDERDEADWVLQDALARRAQRAAALRDVAVLYRTNAQSRSLEEACRRHTVPYRLVGSVRFYDRKEIRDVMAYLRLVANPADDEAFRRAIAVPRRGVGDSTLEAIDARARVLGTSMYHTVQRESESLDLRPAVRTALAAFVALIEGYRARIAELAVDELLRDLIVTINYAEYVRAEGEEVARERLDNLRELISGAAEIVVEQGGEVGGSPLDSFLQRAALVADIDALGSADSDAITLMTMHNAKGLEFPIVYITGLEDGLFPLARAYDDPPLLEEERRLFYVGITRAQQTLALTYAEERRRNGELTRSRPSSFLASIPKGMVDERSTVKVRSTGRAVMSTLISAGRSSRPSYQATTDDDDMFVPAARRRMGTPVAPRAQAEDESQDAAHIAIGSRVRHRKFGAGTIADVSGAGREAKVKIDFDDEAIGRKTLVIAQANLQPELE